MAELQSGEVKLDTLAKLLDISPRHVQRLAKEGWIVKNSRKRYTLIGGVQGYIANLKDQVDRASAKSENDEVRRERARALKLRNDEREGLLVSTEEMRQAAATIFSIFRTGVGALPNRLTRDTQQRALIRQECNAVLTRVKKAIEDL